MGYKNIAKADAQMRVIADDLRLRLAGSSSIDTVREARDADGWPMIFLSDGANEAAGQPVIGLRMKAKDAVSKDVLGNDLAAFAPHAMEIAWELDAGGKPTPAAGDIMKVQAKVAQCGVKIQMKQIANASAVTESNIDAAAVAAEFDQLYWPSSGV